MFLEAVGAVYPILLSGSVLTSTWSPGSNETAVALNWHSNKRAAASRLPCVPNEDKGQRRALPG